jgi:hypothetical protein
MGTKPKIEIVYNRTKNLNRRGEKLNTIQKFINAEGENFTLDKLKQLIRGNYRHSLNGLIQSNLENLSDTKRGQHLTMLDHLTSYAGEVQFKDVDLDFIEGFDRYLRNKEIHGIYRLWLSKVPQIAYKPGI